ncbi:MAG: hypothetical protein JWN99_111, partial [Ilumatobacteraceae bacterium]|nr:hypothetical protein [Ilumatobacteraceae bacterium]
GPSLIDQLAIDVPSPLFDQETAFWSALTGWPWRPKDDPEFEILDRPDGMPLRFLLQRLGADDTRTHVTAHLDIAAGLHATAVAAQHCRLGAEIVGEGNGWITLRDPTGLHYCLTRRDPGG